MTRVFTNPKESYKQSDGVTVNSSGKLYFREPGAGSTTLKAVYANKELTTALVNPVILDASGRAPAIFLDGDYNVQLTTSADVQVWRVDNYDPAAVEGQFDDWESALTYAVNDYVRYTDGKYYISMRSGNTGNVPSSSPTWWSQAFFFTVYNSSTTYAANEVVYYDGNIYTSLQGSNTGNTPDTGFTYWKRPGVSVPTISGYDGQVVTYYSSGAISTIGVPSNIYSGTWRSFGPTGSGADNVWAALDSVPSSAVSLRVAVYADSGRTSSGTGAFYTLAIDSRANGGTNEYPISKQGDYGSSALPSRSYSVATADIILSNDNVFDIRYTETNAEVVLTNISLSLIGFSVAET